MFQNDENIFMVFKKHENGYKFHSVEVAHKTEDGRIIGQSGMFKGQKLIFIPVFRTFSDAALVCDESARLSSIMGFPDMDEYVIYYVQKNYMKY